MNPNTILEENRQTFYMRGVKIQEILYKDPVPIDVFFFHQGHYNILLHQSDSLTSKQWDLLNQNVMEKNVSLFCRQEDREKLDQYFQQKLRYLTRGFSLEILRNKNSPSLFLADFLGTFFHNLHQLYQEPFDSELMEIFYQASFGPIQTLMTNMDYLAYLYFYGERLNYPYHLKQPILSSILLLAFLAHTRQFSQKEMENLYVVSMLKDVGVCFWPTVLFSKNKLLPHEQELIHNHPLDSLRIVSNRVPLSSNYLKILSNHHLQEEQIHGIETQLISLCDKVVAIIQGRPYQKGGDLFHALGIVKSALPAQYNQEYKLFVLFMQIFFRKVSNFSSR